MLNLFKFLRPVKELKIVRVTNIAVNIDIKIPQNNTVAKPFIGPVPNCQRTKAAIKVVTLASIIVVNARSYPPSIAAFGVFPFLSSSLIPVSYTHLTLPTKA